MAKTKLTGSDLISEVNNFGSANQSKKSKAESNLNAITDVVNNFSKALDRASAPFLAKTLAQYKQAAQEANKELKNWSDIARKDKKDKQAQREARREELAALGEIINDPNAKKEDRENAKALLNQAQKQTDRLNRQLEALNKLSGTLDSAVNKQLGYMSSINTRLQGSSKSYSSVLELINRNIGLNAYVKQSKVFEKLNDYVSEGIVYNVEQRAFLGTISEKIAATFEANNKALQQIIKIQQADSTAARLGMESTLNKFLNKNFQDTSYLSGLSDSVSSSILGASSQLSRNGSVGFEYQVQKWLGSLSSVGVSDSTIQSIATGINALGTGDVNALSSNTALQNLLALSANRAGLDYGSLLTGGMNANTTNQLMSGMVSYLQSVAKTDNLVVKTQYANLFGMTISDLTSVLNLSSKDLNTISSNMLSYSDAITETSNELKTLYTRTSAGEMAANIFDNLMTNAARLVTGNTASYLTYLASNVVGDTVNNLLGETKVAPWGVGMSFKPGDLIKGGVAAAYTGTSLLSSIFNKASYIQSFSDEDAWNKSWGASDHILERGRGLEATFADSNIGKNVSQTKYIGNGDDSALYKASVLAADDQVKEINGTSSSAETTENVSKIADVTTDSIDPNVRAIRDILESWSFMGFKVSVY